MVPAVEHRTWVVFKVCLYMKHELFNSVQNPIRVVRAPTRLFQRELSPIVRMA